MIKSVSGRNVNIECNSCGLITEHIIPLDMTSKFIEEFGEYENISFPCECGTVEIINMNIPLDDTDEPFETGDLPLDEEIQRFYVRTLQREIREDFKAM